MNCDETAGLEQWLARVRSEYWERLGEVSDDGDVPTCSHVLFEVCGQRFAVEAQLCKAVVRRPRPTRLPGLPAHCMGVVAIRGEVVSVVDTDLFLQLPGERERTEGFLLVLAADDIKAALWVDRVADVLDLLGEETLPVESPWAGLPDGVVLGQWSDDAGPVLVLDGRQVLISSAAGA